MNVKDLTGQRFGRLVAIEPTKQRNRGAVVWRCKCDCGTECLTTSTSLIRGKKSCGCLKHEILSKQAKEQKHRLIHGMVRTKDYYRWTEIKKRCQNPNCKNYPNYGGRGIKVCDEWCQDFQSYYDYVSKLPHYGEEGYSLDRINNDGDYEPGNVRWATRTMQARNKQDTVRVNYEGLQYTLYELSQVYDVKPKTIYARYRRGAPLITKEEKEAIQCS